MLNVKAGSGLNQLFHMQSHRPNTCYSMYSIYMYNSKKEG